ncbi:hypothetical protein RFI_08102 [Reticulomyxa filosa]|uniref:Uncharacterized protein n=1 Tax=Reticulomyxa filosa TaxID=46433 RepID=X6NSQ1_RETFI|nr:hypothetical protein RFI_08102 [Reticulomyxa filosa]|eukprot:ETO29026.1 hypothetical protein RFI_08102 [Reticulomyxa filosa]
MKCLKKIIHTYIYIHIHIYICIYLYTYFFYVSNRNDKDKSKLLKKGSESNSKFDDVKLDNSKSATTSSTDLHIVNSQKMLLRSQSMSDLTAVTDSDFSNFVVGKNIKVYFGVGEHKAVPDTCKVTYVLQCKDGGWIPQTINDLGMVEQHMIKIFFKMTDWLLNRTS